MRVDGSEALEEVVSQVGASVSSPSPYSCHALAARKYWRVRMDPNPNISSAASVWSDQTPSIAIDAGSLFVLQMWWLLLFDFFFLHSVSFGFYFFSKNVFACLILGIFFYFLLLSKLHPLSTDASHITCCFTYGTFLVSQFQISPQLKKKVCCFFLCYFCRMLHWVSTACSPHKFLWLAGWLHLCLHKFLCVSVCAPCEILVTLGFYVFFPLCLSWCLD